MSDTTDPDMRAYALHRGIIVDNKDPKRLGRVQVRIPGYIEPSTEWAMPMGAFGGMPGEGFWAVPDIGAAVIVFFAGGDVENPYWIGGPWSKPRGQDSKIPTDAAAAMAEDGDQVAAQLKTFETKSFVLTFDERADNEFAQLRHKASGDVVEIDGRNRGVRIHATAGLVLESDGLVQINGLQVQINNRIVMPTSKPI